MILDKIVATKRLEIETMKKTVPISILKKASRKLPAPRDFKAAINNTECSIIAEVKRKSPSKGIFKTDFDPLKFASIYEENGAAAISVLTDELFFGGQKHYLSAIKKIVKLPILRKDFIIDPYQIYETKIIGGDALLLIAGILEDEILEEFITLAKNLGIYSLVEVHSKEDIDKAISAGAEIIGINNRNLKTFSTDLNITLDLAFLIPGNKIIISESGIRSREDIELLMKKGIHTFLVGETLMKANDMGEKLKELLGEGE